MSIRNLTEEQIKAMINLGNSVNPRNPQQDVKKAHFSPLLPQATDQSSSDISCLQEVEVEMQVELGCTSINLREVLALQPDKVIALNRLAGAMVDLKVNNVWLAYAEVLVLKDSMGVRIASFKGDEKFSDRGAK